MNSKRPISSRIDYFNTVAKTAKNAKSIFDSRPQVPRVSNVSPQDAVSCKKLNFNYFCQSHHPQFLHQQFLQQHQQNHQP